MNFNIKYPVTPMNTNHLEDPWSYDAYGPSSRLNSRSQHSGTHYPEKPGYNQRSYIPFSDYDTPSYAPSNPTNSPFLSSNPRPIGRAYGNPSLRANQLPVVSGSYSGIFSNPASPQYSGLKPNSFLTRELRDSNKYLSGRIPRIGAALTAGMAASSMSDGGIDTAFMGAGLAYAGGSIASNMASSIRPWAAKTLRNTAETSSVQRGGLQAAKFLTSTANRNLLFAGGAMLTGLSFGAMRANSQSLATGLNGNRGSRPVR